MHPWLLLLIRQLFRSLSAHLKQYLLLSLQHPSPLQLLLPQLLQNPSLLLPLSQAIAQTICLSNYLLGSYKKSIKKRDTRCPFF